MKVSHEVVGQAILTMTFAVCLSCFADTAKIAAMIVDDETGRPIKGASVVGSFRDDIGWRAWTESAKPVLDRAVTDETGLCRLSGRTNCGDASFWVKTVPDGYYKAGFHVFHFKEKDAFGVWQPDNLVATIRLQRVEYPIPLFVKKVSRGDRKRPIGGFDGTNAVLRYDFVKGDWLPPDGKGEVADMEVSTTYRLVNVRKVTNLLDLRLYEFENRIAFLGEGNGVIEKMSRRTDGLRLRTAPLDGYARETVRRFGVKGNPIGTNVYGEEFSDSDDSRVCVFRVRSRFDEHGNLVGGHYGKIYGDFQFHGDWKIGFRGVDFLCYLNPTPLDRNLEWDMKNNLCPNPGIIGECRP